MNTISGSIFASDKSFVHLMHGFIIMTDEPNIIKNKLIERFGKKTISHMFFVSANAVAVFASNSLHGFSNNSKIITSSETVSFDTIRQIGGFKFESAGLVSGAEQFIIDNALKMFVHTHTCTNYCWYVCIYDNNTNDETSDPEDPSEEQTNTITLTRMLKVVHTVPRVDINKLLAASSV